MENAITEFTLIERLIYCSMLKEIRVYHSKTAFRRGRFKKSVLF